MTKTLFAKYGWFRLAIVWALVALVSLLMPLGVEAQKDTRQLKREESKNQEKRIALIIGNGSYTDSPLRNPPNDATDMAATLKTLGFEVSLLTNSNQIEMKRAIRSFGEQLRGNGGIGLFYYAGHGVQVKGANYLIPVGASVNTEEEVEYEGIDVGLVLAQMESAKNKLNIVILDACRNNPFARSFRSADKGLASIDAPAGTLLAYSTAPGSVASDGTGRNGLYTQELLKAIRTDNLSIEDVFKRVRVSVRNTTANKQTPWESSSLTGNFYFAGKANTISRENLTISSETVKTVTLPSAEEVFLSFSKALGYEKFKEINTIVQKGIVEGESNGQKWTGIIEFYQKYPDKSLSIMKFSNKSIAKEIYNGDQGWLWGSGTGTKEATPQQLDFHKRNLVLSVGDISSMKNYYPKVILKGIEKIGDKDAYVIEATKLDGKTELMYFDILSKLPIRWDFAFSSVATQSGITFLTQLYLEDFIDLNGFQLPLTIRQQNPQSTTIIKFNMSEIKFNVPLDDKLFKKP